ncbi:MAG: hypothetical protein KBC84_07115, partial [Proteobacteria bacterium]|nr:hypothetical protein [Pseudomonadota bacterium]
MKVNAFKIAINLLSIPRLFASLLFWPIVIGLSCAVVQISASSAYIKFVEEKPQDYIKRLNAPDEFSEHMRNFLVGRKSEFTEIKVCRWSEVDGVEKAPVDCEVHPLDVAINTDNVTDYNQEQYLNLYKGNVERLHICKSCKTDMTIHTNLENKNVTTITSLHGILLHGLVETTVDKKLGDHFINFKVKAEEYKKTSGTILFYPSGFKSPINFSKATVI